MRRSACAVVGLLLLSVSAVSAAGLLFAAVEMPASSYLTGLTWLGHASFRLERAGAVVYFDPWEIAAEPHDADLILISHPHFDHLDAASVARLARPATQILTTADCAAKLKEAGITEGVRVMRPGEKVTLKPQEITVEAVPAYNTNKPYHPKEKEWLGFIVEIDGVRLYHAGDTDLIPEMAMFKVDVAMLPVSGTYVMTAEEAASSAKAINPKVAVPMHYGRVVGAEADARRFQAACGSLITEVLEKGSIAEKK